MFSVWRITNNRFTQSAFSGDGARRFGGRWNTPGIPLIYASESKSLAVLEILVHLDSPDLLQNYVLFEVKVEDEWVSQTDLASLPKDWRADPPPVDAQRIGNEWAASARSAVLQVPSAIVAGEFNFLLNPRHPDFRKLKISPAQPFLFDARLARRNENPRTKRR